MELNDNYSSRNVIRQDPSLRIDQVGLPYAELVITQKAQIENILHRMYNISYQEAYNKWYRSISHPDPVIVSIIQSLIDNSGPIDPKTGKHMGLPVIINRNNLFSSSSNVRVLVG